MKRLRVAAATNVIPHYRQRFWELVHERGQLDVTLFCQTEWPGTGLHLVHDEVPQPVVPLHHWGDERHLGWQHIPMSLLAGDFDVFYWMGAPRLLSTVLWATLQAKLGKPVVIGGQAHSASSNRWSEALRLRWWRSFKHLIVYTDSEEEYLRARGFADHYIRGMNNGLDQKRIDAVTSRWSKEDLARFAEKHGLNDRTVTTSLGRMSDYQHLDLFLEALPELVKLHPDLLHVVIGDGPQRRSLEARAEQLGVADHVRWLGAIWEEEELAPWLLSSTLMVHPGTIGLGLMHSFGYGLPLVTQDDPLHHGPEFAAFEDGVTGRGFRQGDVSSLRKAVSSLLSDPPATRVMGAAALERVQTRFNVEVMVDRFTEVILAAHAAAD